MQFAYDVALAVASILNSIAIIRLISRVYRIEKKENDHAL